MENLNKVVKEIKIVAKPSKRGGKNHFVRVELINGRSADVWCDKEIIELILMLKWLSELKAWTFPLVLVPLRVV